MAKTCEICGKTKKFGNNVSFSLKSTKRSWAPNIRKVKAVVDGQSKRINVCTKCIKSGNVVKPAAKVQ